MSYTVAGAVLVAVIGIVGLLVVKKLLDDEKKKQVKLRAPRRLRLSTSDVAAQESAEAKRRKNQNPKFGRKTFEKPKSARKMFSWS